MNPGKSNELNFFKTTELYSVFSPIKPHNEYLQINSVDTNWCLNTSQEYYCELNRSNPKNNNEQNWNENTASTETLISIDFSNDENCSQEQYNISSDTNDEELTNFKITRKKNASFWLSSLSTSLPSKNKQKYKNKLKNDNSKGNNSQLTLNPTILKKKRLAANARERKRMNSLNEAYERLREIVPSTSEEQKMSKFETLQMAQTYILALCDLLKVGEMDDDKITTFTLLDKIEN